MQHGFSRITIALFILLMLVVCTDNGIASDQVQTSQNIASDAMPGFFNIGVPYGAAPRLSIAGTARYGLIESIGPQSGIHHELGGTIAIGGTLWPWISAALILDGEYQKHPADDEGSDYSIVGVPELKFRGGSPVGKHLLLGGEIDARFTGEEAPSLQLNATVLSGKLLATIISLAPFQIGLMTGFCLDYSENGAPARDSLRPGDRIALDASNYHAVLFGLALAWQVKQIRFILEADSRKYITSEVPFSTSPTRITLGAQYSITKALQLDLSTETIVSKRPGVETDDPLVPILPRFTALLGIRYTWHSAESPKSGENTNIDAVVPPIDSGDNSNQVKKPVATGTVQGQILDEESLPITDATVTVVAADGSNHTTVTDKNGNYALRSIPVGPAEGTVEAEYFEPTTFKVDVAENITSIAAPETLVQSKVGSQIRGLIRDVSGAPLNATILILPGRIKTQTDSEGFFEVDVNPGQYTVEIFARGFVRQKQQVNVGENSVVVLNVDLRAKN
ncbi:MAG: carboxypeptidase regulatory-like domain-containing protein [Deltaproteobacteria bacterium]|nr:carboxypeptidase regulatory-like domain-containing protein [Deltaproteobacteria bacterium]